MVLQVAELIEDQGKLLGDVFGTMSQDEQLSMWRFAAAGAKRLPHRGPNHAKLCLAISVINRGGSRSKPVKISSLHATRSLSAEDLQRDVLRLKSRLLAAPAGITFVAMQFGSWVQINHLETLIAVLRKMNCPHDTQGFLTGSIPQFTLQQAEAAIDELRERFSLKKICLVCYALVISGLPRGGLWTGLRPALDALAASTKDESILRSMVSELHPPLAHATAPPLECSPAPMEGAVESLPSDSASGGQLNSKAFGGSQQPRWFALATRCMEVRHVSDPHFIGLEKVVAACEELLLARAEDLLPDDERLTALESLERCIASGTILDDLEYDNVHASISVTFGTSVANAALRGRLAWHPSEASAADGEALHDCPETPAPPEPGTFAAAPLAPRATAGQELAAVQADLSDIFLSQQVPDNATVAPPSVEEHEIAYLRFFRTDFESEFWVNENGIVRPAPWRRKDHVSRVTSATMTQWAMESYGVAFLHIKSLSELGAPAPYSYEDLCDAHDIFSMPTSLQAGLNHERIVSLKAAISTSRLDDMPCFRIATILEAVRPTQPCTLSDLEIERIVEMAAFKNGALASLTSWMLSAWAAGANPLPQLRENMSASAPEDLNLLQKILGQTEMAFKDTVASVWSAAGGRLRHTHSRRAWSQFIQEFVVPLRTEFGSISQNARLHTTDLSNRMRSSATRLTQRYLAIMVEVKFQDRVAADSAVNQITEKLLLLSDVVDRIGSQKKRLKLAFDACPQDELRRLLSEHSADPTDQLCRNILLAVLQLEYPVNPLQIDSAVLLSAPDTIKHLTPEAIVALSQDETRIPIASFADPVAASTLLLSPLPHRPPSDDVLSDIRELAIERDRRDILSALSPANVLAPHERTLLFKSALDASERLFSSLRELERLSSICDLLMVDDEPILLQIIDEARYRVKNSDSINSLIDGQLLEGWLENNIVAAKRSVEIAELAHVKMARARSPELGDGIERFLAQGQYRNAVALLHGELSSLLDSPGMKLRETIWRSAALRQFEEPQMALQTLFNKGDGAQIDLATVWVNAASDFDQRDAARRALYVFVSREDDVTGRGSVLRKDLRDHYARKTVIDRAALREYLQKAGLNPTFLSQLADFGRIVLTTAGGACTRPEAALDEYARLVAIEQTDSLVVFIEPGLSQVRRDELCEGLRRRRLLAAVVDDVDVCRLCDARRSDSPAFIALIEIILEQLDLQRVSPFSTQDGQHVRIESYVGRAREAEDLAIRSKYTCVFSGRKLGKSALLKYVARKYNGHELISGNVLRVIFITIAGGESEQWVVQCIIDEMVKAFGMAELPVQAAERPRDRLSSYMHAFLQSDLKASVLLILDEADTFVEGQLANYDSDREASLSFCLLKELPAQVDSNEMPRIRTIFSGYRVTNTRDGVWANAGDVLILHPLDESEAVEFITGTLARVGVDIGVHAAYVARRCGRQPAVLIRFGECLLKHLTRTGTGARRETIVVTEATISAALTDQGVHDEIRTVVANNFQGHKVGQVIFNATLMALKELAPGQALDDAPSQILAKLRMIDSDFGWLERMNASPLAVVERNLQEFIERELLAMHDAQRFGVREYRLKFPHFLPVLTQSETALETQQLISAIRNSSKQPLLNRCALSDTSLENLRYWYRQKTAEGCQLVVVGGQWIESLIHDKCGVPDRLGCSASEVVFAPPTEHVERLVSEGKRVFVNPTIDIWPILLAIQVPRPIVVIGGVQWLRKALSHALDGGEVPVEVIAQGRLSESTVGWWIESARALHLESAGALPIISDMTDGIPILLGAFDTVLQGSPADELKTASLLKAKADFESKIVTLASTLTEGSFSGHLTPRERELLLMAVHVSKELNGAEFDLETEFHLYWELCPDTLSCSGPPLTMAEDRLALQLLSSCGLLSVTDEGSTVTQSGLGRARINPDGPLARLVNAMGVSDAG